MWLARYNQLSSVLWLGVLFGVLWKFNSSGQPITYQDTNLYVTGVQSLALVEVYNSAVGNVRSPVFTTAMQVASRLVLVFGIVQLLPQSPANQHWSYVTMCVSWSITEVIRYLYYAMNITSGGNPPKWLSFLRYNTFLVLYPTGVFSELCMIYLSLPEAAKAVGPAYALSLKIIMATYAPGFYMLFTYMIRQRRKVMKGLMKRE